MSDSNRTAVAIVEETNAGAIPNNPIFEAIRITGENLGAEAQSTISDELRADRQIVDLIRVGQVTGGDLPVEFSYGNLDHLLRGAMFSEWVVTPVRDNNFVAASITGIVAASQTVNVAASTSDYRARSGAFVIGQLVRMTGFTNLANNGLRRVTTGGATSFISATSGLVDEPSPPATARVKVVGIEAPAVGNISATTAGLGAGAVGALVFAGGLDAVALGLVPGQWIKASGFTGTAANNGWYRILTVVAARVEFDRVPTGFATDAAAGQQVRLWVGDYIRNGTTQRSFAAEVQYQDLAVPEFEYHRGLVVGQVSFSMEAQTKITGSVAFEGLSTIGPVTTRGGGGAFTGGATDRAAPIGDVLNTSSHVGRIGANGQDVTGPNFVMSAALNISNTLRRRNAVGSLGSASIGAGRFNVTGTLNTYYGSNAFLTLLRNNSLSSWDVRLIDPNGVRAIIFDLPNLKFSEGSPTVPGVDTDRMLELSFQGLRSPVFGYTLHIQRVEEFV